MSEATEILESILNELDPSTFDSSPQYIISGSGWGFYLDPETQQMVMTPRGTEIVPVDDITEEDEKVLCKSPYRFLLIPVSEVQEIGWN
tara:strand:- start:33 stop:299 length:267 start_codon:yes stop_codon:yes gene_type:complete